MAIGYGGGYKKALSALAQRPAELVNAQTKGKVEAAGQVEVAGRVQAAVTDTITSNTTINSGNAATYTGHDIVCDGAGVILTVDGTHTWTSLTLQNGCTLKQTATTTTVAGKTDITITGSGLTINSGTSINLDNLVYRQGYTSDGSAGSTPTTTGAASGAAPGGSHGG